MATLVLDRSEYFADRCDPAQGSHVVFTEAGEVVFGPASFRACYQFCQQAATAEREATLAQLEQTAYARAEREVPEPVGRIQ